jgi:choline dehydrogenase-like flavoprotein
MIYIRGNPLDYAAWGPGWSWEDVLPNFLRAEDNERGASALHGAGGPLSVSDGRSNHPLADAWIGAAADAGLERNDDFNGPRQDGVGRYQVTQRGGMRCSAAVAYLHPALSRPNLTLIPNAPVTRLLFEGARAVGAEALIEGVPQPLRAAREVVLCGGAYNSPQLLMLSGIGPAEHLMGHGLDVRLDQPAVGANLSDHVNAGLIIRTETETLMTAESEANVALLQTEGRGPLTSNIAEAGGFWRSRGGLEAPDIQFHMAPVMFAEEGLLPPTEHAWSVGACVLTPSERGEVRLRSADPTAKPLILTRWLDSEQDWDAMLAAQRLLLEIARRPAIARHGTEPYQAPASDSDHDLRHHVREVAHCLYHPVGTCAIGTVVDAELRVQGVDGLRVADASVMPDVPRGNTNAPSIMIGERAADLLLGSAPVAAADAKAAA